MADSFIYRLNESTVIKTDDYTLFDILNTDTGDYYTRKVSYGTLVKQLTSGIIDNVKSRLDTLQSTLNLANTEISKKLDKTGLSFSPSEIVTGILSVNARLSVFDIAEFNKNIDLHRNQIKNLATPTDNFDAVNKKYVDDRFDVLSIPNLGNYLLKTGDTMTGSLTLPATTPTQNFHAATKKYVDDKFPSNVYLPLSGGTMTGNLVVLTPTSDNHPATKKYVDDRITTGAYLPLSGGTMTGNLSVLEPSLANHAATKLYVDNKLPNTGVYLPLSGGTMTGDLFVNGNPTNNSQVANKAYVDSIGGSFVPLSGGTMTGALSVVDPPTLPLHATSKRYVDSRLSNTLFLPISGGTMTGNLSVQEPSLTNHAATKKYVDDKVPSGVLFLPLSGGTMTGPLSVITPTNNSHAANKAYVDSRNVAGTSFLPISGGTMTGALSVLDPTLPLHAANKKYADSVSPVGKYVPLSGGTMTGTLVLSGYSEAVQSFTFAPSGDLTINCANGKYNNNISLDLNANITGFNFLNLNTIDLRTYSFTFFIKQKGNIPNFYDVTWKVLTAFNAYTNVKWASGAYTGSGPRITKLTNAIDIITLTRINGEWFGFSSGQNF